MLNNVATTITFATAECFLGHILVATRKPESVCAIFLGNDPQLLRCELQTVFPHANLIENKTQLHNFLAKIVNFIETPVPEFELLLDICGTVFQQRVWQALMEIPMGSTVSYSDIAKRIGAPKSVRAVANACGANLLSIAIPCHRVLRSNGKLSGYRWGVHYKRMLLDREMQQTRSLAA